MSEVTRLYRFFKPSRYELHLATDKTNLSFNGQVTILGDIEKDQKKLRLHSKDLSVEQVSVNGYECEFKQKNKFDELVINIPKNCPGNLKIQITFKGDITKQMHGLYPCKSRSGEVILATQFESHHAREVFPCIDEPEAKAVFSLKISGDINDIILANTESVSEEADGQVKTSLFADTPLMSTYLLAFVTGNLDCQETTSRDGVKVRAWATPDQSAYTSFALDVATKSLEFYNDYFGIPYPLNKCDIVALPDFAAGAMENWGLLTFRETCLLVDPANTSLESQQYVAMIVAHEVAHQWFGNLVTMRWWNDLWLNEGFASWIEFMAVDKIFPEWRVWTQFIAIEQHQAFRLDALNNTHAIEVEVPNPDEINTIFDSISYSKGACVIHMLHGYLGKNNFRLGLVHYLNKYAYKNTETSDLWDALAEASGLKVADFIGHWTKQKGFPYVSLEKSGNHIKLSQERFLANGNKAGSPAIWPIPLLADNLPEAIFDTKELVLDLKSNYVKLNAGQAGFYITKYWPAVYETFADKIKNNQLAETERIGLLSDMLALAKAGHLPAVELLNILKAFKNDTSLPVWNSVAACLGDIRHILGDDVRQQIKPFIRQLVDEQYNRLGWIEKPSEVNFDKMLRPLILGLASGADNEQATAEAKSRFDSAKSIIDIGSNLRSMILTSVARRGGQTEFNRMINMLKTTKSPEDTIILTHSISNYKNPKQYKKAIKLIKSDYVRLQDIHYWIVYGLANPEARIATWDWIKNNWGWLKANMGNDMAYPRLPLYISKAFNTQEFLADFNNFFDSMHEPALNRGIKQGKETIKTQAAWRKRDEQAVLDWLKTNY
jgi:puromycin-sensitive aminopeptidase